MTKGVSAAEIIAGAEQRKSHNAVCFRGAKNWRGESCPCQHCMARIHVRIIDKDGNEQWVLKQKR